MIKKLKQYIEDSGLKKKKVAELLGITPVYLSYILNGNGNPSLELEGKIKNLVDYYYS